MFYNMAAVLSAWIATVGTCSTVEEHENSIAKIFLESRIIWCKILRMSDGFWGPWLLKQVIAGPVCEMSKAGKAAAAENTYLTSSSNFSVNYISKEL